MIIVELMPGGLASQMTSYSVYRKFQKLDSETQLDISYFESVAPENYKKLNLHNGYELARVFGLEPALAKTCDVEYMKDTRKTLIDRVRRKLFGVRKTHYFERSLNYSENIFTLKNKYVSGYWMSLKYFEDIRDTLLSDFTFKADLCEANRDFLQKIKMSNSVAVHIRRGDFVNNSVHGGICDLDYYLRAIRLITKLYGEASFYFFSDDPKWVVENFREIKNAVIVDVNKGDSCYIDMFLMSSCRHNIISNSGFGWWAAWLNQNPDKFVITPKKWINMDCFDYTQIIPKEWVSV